MAPSVIGQVSTLSSLLICPSPEEEILTGEEKGERNSRNYSTNFLTFRKEESVLCLENKAGYTAQDAPSMRTFHLRKKHGTKGPTDGPTDGRTQPLIEMRRRI